MLTPLTALPPKDIALEGPNIRMEPIRADYAEELYQISHPSPDISEKLWKYMSWGPFTDANDMKTTLDFIEKKADWVGLVIIDKKSGRKIGQMVYINIAPSNRSLEIGNIWYAPEFQRTYANTESVFLALTHAFEEMGYRRVEWKCDNLNEKSKNAALGLGFTFEGIFRQHMIIKGLNRDTAWFSVIDSEWPAVKKRLQDRLDKYKK
jgi:RimJ/RimL family protein N-acetyltransferase